MPCPASCLSVGRGSQTISHVNYNRVHKYLYVQRREIKLVSVGRDGGSERVCVWEGSRVMGYLMAFEN